MAEVSIASVVDNLEGSLVRTRDQGLEDLRRLLGSSRNGNKLHALGEDGFHKILESIYRIVRTERATYLTQVANGTKTVTTVNKLTSAATALRLTVEAGCVRLKHKSALSVLDHIISCLPTAEDAFIEPLRSDYLKCFKSVVEHGPHGEHLRPKKWQELVDFILVGIDISFSDDDSGNTNVSTKNANAKSGMSVSFRTSQASTQRSSRSTAGHAVDDLLGSLRALSNITNMPLASRAAGICDRVVECLMTVPRAQELALDTFNNAALVLLTEDLAFLQAKIESVIQVYRHMWVSKSTPALRDQILISLYSLRPLLLARPGSVAAINPQLKQQLLSSLLTEYAGRYAKDMLHFDEITLRLVPNPMARSPSYDFRPTAESRATMASWTLLEVIALLVTSLSSEQNYMDRNLEDDHLPRKRRKVELPIHDLMTQALRSRGGHQVAALQVLFFLMSVPSPLVNEVGRRTADFGPLLMEDDPNVCNWAMLLFSKLVWSASTRRHISNEIWKLLLDAAQLSMTTSAKSRAGCLLFDALLQQSSTESGLDIPTMQKPFLLGGRNGPAVFTDAALLMFTTAFASDVLEQESVFETAGLRVVDWLISHWTLPEALDRVHNAHLASHAPPEVLCRLLAAITGSHLHADIVYHHGEPAPLVRARATVDGIEPLVSYLGNTAPSYDAHPKLDSTAYAVRHLSNEASFRLHSRVSDLLLSKMRDFKQAWEGYAVGRLTGSSNDIATIVASAFVVARLISSIMLPRASTTPAVDEASNELWKLIEKSLPRTTETSSHLQVVAATILRMRDEPASTSFPIAKALSPSSTFMIQATQKSRPADNQGEDDDSDIDMMESMESRTSQRSKASQELTDLVASRRETILSAASRMTLPSLRLELLVEAAKAKSHDTISTQEIAKVVDEIVSMNGQELIEARKSVTELLNLDPAIGRPEAGKILEAMATSFLKDYNFERNEVALCFLARIMAILAPRWASADKDDVLTDRASDIYRWLIGKAIAKGVASDNLKVSIANMLDMITQLSPSIAGDELPSPRTSLLNLLKHGTNLVKFELSPLLVHLFERYILSEHEAIFRDIVESLPSDLDHFEGVAVRFYLLAEIGARWPTILRHATYHLYETAVNVPRAQDLGRCCVTKLSLALDLSSPQKLFELFAGQIFYIWLGDGIFADIPYAVFGYNSVLHLVTANKSEIAAQIALRGGKHHAEQLSNLLDLEWPAILTEHFAHAEAYCLASQISLPEGEQLYPNAETRLRKDVGIDVYRQKLQDEIPVIVSHLLLSLQDVRGIERAFEKSELLQALANWKHISHLSDSSIPLPIGQQPFFRAKYLVDELQWLSSQAGHIIAELWSPSVLVYLYRTLLMTADPAMGALHACSVLRKIKIVLSLGGSSTATGYPLEMLLHNLRPYLTIFQCSEDAIGIYWFLLEKGKMHLSSRTSFLVGLTTSVFSALCLFVKSPQDSTTQESHFMATMTRAQKFSSWLGQYLRSFHLTDENQHLLLQEIIGHISGLAASGTNAASTHEGMLFMCLIRDRASTSPIIHESHFDLAIRSLCKNFILAEDPGDDILASPDQCSRYAGVIRDILHRIDLNDSFRIWAAQVIGRACSFRGPDIEARALELKPDKQELDLNQTTAESYSGILKSLDAALWQDAIRVAGSAEETLQSIAGASHESRSEAFTISRKDYQVLEELQDDTFVCPCPSSHRVRDLLVPALEGWQHAADSRTWCANLVVALCLQVKSDPVLDALGPLASTAPPFSASLVPYVVHLVLSAKQNGAHGVREQLSVIFAHVLSSESPQSVAITQVALNTILYLRRCRMPIEKTLAHRDLWLDIDFGRAAEAATRCQSWHTALLCVEIKQAQQHLQATRSSRRSTQSSAAPACLDTIYQNVDDPDFFYAGHHDADMHSIIKRLEHESADQKMLSFQSAVLDSMMRTEQSPEDIRRAAVTTARALSAANMQSISQAVNSFANDDSQSSSSNWHCYVNHTHQVWDIGPSAHKPVAASAMDNLRTLATATDLRTVVHDIDRGLLNGASRLAVPESERGIPTKVILRLAMLSEAKDLLTLGKTHGIESCLERLSKIRGWGQRLDFDDLSAYLNCREFTFSMVRRNDHVGEALQVTKPKALLYEAQIICQSLQNVAHHESSQFQLSRAAYLAELAKNASGLGIRMEAFSQYYLAKTVFRFGEISASVDILRKLRPPAMLPDQDLNIDNAEILAELGEQISSARLEPPDEIISNYLVPAYKELRGQTAGANAGRVFHFFATFCDTQLQDPSNRDDYSRALEKRALKIAEVHDLKKQHKKAERHVKKTIGIYMDRAESWVKIYNEEYEQKVTSRETLISQCLENYLRSMTASDDFPNDKLRLLAIWLDAAESAKANGIVNKYIKTVPSWKFATLVNQLVSRLSDTQADFQEILNDLMFRISSDHPHHSLYQMFAVSKSKSTEGDEMAASRHAAATKLTEVILKKSVSSGIWVAIHNCGINFIRVAQAKLPEKRTKFNLRQLSYGDKLISSVEGTSRKIPPPAMRINLRVNKDYSSLPVMVELQSQVSIAGGVSAPKITTAIASDGSLHKMLLKAGNDDLRQDSIMEQVFEEVSSLLSDHKSTRQRKLGIRTYKVVPLITNAGIIEFVQGTTPLHDYLLPAHERYFPKDYNRKRCRSDIADAAEKPLPQRIQAYRTVASNFHPVMRFFFMENFPDPNEWFYKRLNYSRSSAAISILGHVLGLGDRHGHNILLDKNTGEVVHIDLGVAFEAGRILPVPEVVPFRLTRDLVDGMGISGVEGVFRRCCNFTLEALRQDQESIMTLLDVLRYDPLVSWSLSPYRLKKMQQTAEISEAEGMNEALAGETRSRDEANEADRALTVVREKLSKNLSVEAEVNELIRQATDERRLAVLFAGWAAYA